MNGATVLTKFTADTKDFDKGVQKVDASVGSIAKGTIVATGVTKAFSAAWGLVSKNTDLAIERFDALNNFPKVMSNLGISAKDSQKSIDKLADKLQGLPTTLQDGALAVQRLTSKNGDIKKSTDLFLAMNNAILAGGASSEIQSSAIEQLSQAYAKGKPDMMEWRTLMMAMPAQLKQVATAMGYVDADALGEDLRNGTVSMDDFMDTINRLNTEGLPGFQNFEQQAKNSTGGIRTAITNMNSRIAAGLTEMFNAINKGLEKANMGNLATIFENVGNSIKDILKGLAPIITNIITILANMFNWISKHKTLIEAIAVPILAIIAAMKIWSIITGTVSTAMALLNAIMAMNPITLIILAIIALVAAFVFLWNKCEWFRDFWIGLWEGIKEKFQIFVDFIKLAWDGLKLIFNIAVGVIKNVIDKIVEKFNNFKTKVKNIADSIKNFFQSLPSKMLKIGTDIVKGLWNGIKNVKQWLTDKIKGFVNGAVKSIKKFFGIKSPSKVMAKEVGQWLPKGIAVGIDANTDAINKSMSSMQKEMMSTFQLSPQVANSAALHYSPTVISNVEVNMKQDPLGQMVRDVKTFSGGAKNDYNYGMGV